MRENSIIKERILQFLDFKGISKYEFYQKTGISNGILSQKNGISEENILKFLSAFCEISIEWLLTGKGEMLKDNGSVISQTIKGNGNISNAGNNNINIPIQTTQQESFDDKEVLKELRNIIKDKDQIIADLREELKEKREELKEIKEELKEKNSQIQDLLNIIHPTIKK